MKRWGLRAAMLVTALLFIQLLAAALPAEAFQTETGAIPGKYIVVYRDDIVLAADVTELVDLQPGVAVTQTYAHALNGFAADLSTSAVRNLQSDPRVAMVIPDRKMYPFAQTLTPGANRIDADLNPYADIDGVDDRVDADIAILDMGVGPHSDLNIAGGYDCTGQGTTRDNGGHGTHVAGIAAAKDNTTGMVGVAPGARIWSVKVLDAYDGNWSWVLCGIDWVTAHADVIEVANMSLGEDLGPSNQGFDGPMHQAIQRSVAAGVIYVVAAGNGAGDASTVIPATYDEVITVSAIGDSDGKPGGLGPTLSAGGDDRFANFSDYGKDVDIAAPGVDTYSTAPGGSYSRMSGTSFATPHVTGAVALYIAQHGRVGPAAVRAALLATADPGKIPGDPDGYAEGVLNVGRFGGSSIKLSTLNGKPGDKVTATLSAFPANVTVALTWDGKSFTTVGTDGSGKANLTFTIPAMKTGVHLLTGRQGSTFGTVPYTVNPSIKLSPASGYVGTELKVVLRGMASKEKVALQWKNGATTTTLARATASSAGSADIYITIPASLGGSHQITALGETSTNVKATFTVLARIAPSPRSALPDSTISISLRGFQSKELVEIRLQTTAGTVVLGTESVSSESGSRNATLRIPAEAAPGSATLHAVGNKSTIVSAPLTIKPAVNSAEAATPTPTPDPATPAPETPTAEPTVESTPEPTPTETPAIGASPEIESTPERAITAIPIARTSHSGGSDSGRVVSDGDLSTVWVQTGRSREPYLRLDLGGVQTVGQIRWFQAEGITGIDLRIEVSVDRRTWQPVDLPAQPVAGWQEIAVAVDARYIRFVYAASDGQTPVGGIAEVEVYP